MSDPVSLLPSNSTPWETAQDLTSAARRPLPVDIIRRVWNPQTCPVELLPYLAWGLGLELWRDDWTETKKRDVVSRVWLIKRRKTTLQGIRDYVNLAGGDIAKAVLPRHKMWWVPSMTEAERQALMTKMPEIRIFPDAPHSARGPAQSFYGASYYGYAVSYYPDDSATLYRDRAVFIENGKETRVTVTGIDHALDSSYTVALRANSPAKAFYGKLQFAPLHFRVPSDAAEHVISISPNAGALSFAVPSGLLPASVKPVSVVDTVPAAVYKAFHYPSFYNASFRLPSDASKHVYDSLRFMDPANVGAFGRPMSFWGFSHSGISPFTAQLTLTIPLKAPVWAFRQWWGVGYWNRQNMSPLWDSLAAITIAQAARDEIWASLQLYQEVNFDS